MSEFESVVRGHPSNACFRCGASEKEKKLGYSKFNNGWLCTDCASGSPPSERPPEPEIDEAARRAYEAYYGPTDWRWDLADEKCHQRWRDVARAAGVAERRDPLEPSERAIEMAIRAIAADYPLTIRPEAMVLGLRAAYAIDRRGTGAEPTAPSDAIAHLRERLASKDDGNSGLVVVRRDALAGALRAGGPAREEPK